MKQNVDVAGGWSRLQRNIDPVLSECAPTMREHASRFSCFFAPFFSPLRRAHCLSPLSTLFVASHVLFIRVACTVPCTSHPKEPTVRTIVSLPRCARGFHIKENYLLMRSNYPAHNGKRQHAIVEGVGSKARSKDGVFVGTAIVRVLQGYGDPTVPSLDDLERSSCASGV